MAKDRRDTVDLLQQQNQLLQSLNQLLKQQNDLMRGSSEPVEEREEFVENLYRDEIRNGFLVTSHRKKLWNVQIDLLNEFSRICKKYDLRWYATGGTLLGGARHKGFIPWDDDVDVVMFRPEYEKFKEVAPREIQYPYFFDNWYEYRLESEEKFPDQLDPNLQWVTLKQEKRYSPSKHLTQWPSIRLRNSSTIFLERGYEDRKHVHQGIFIDIFPLDPMPPFEDKKQAILFETERQLLMATAYPNLIKNAIKNNKPLVLPHEEFEEFLRLPYRERGARLEEFQLKNFFKSKHVGQIISYIRNATISYKAVDFDGVVQLPFEKIEISAPSGYDSVLTTAFGDWHKMIFTHSHAQTHSADISYIDYFRDVKV